ncbi:hypothetical protein D3C80_2163920 [compost metagenome]
MKYEVGLIGNTRYPRLDPPIQRIQTVVESLEVALIARRIGRVSLSQVSSHFRRDYPRVDRG